MDVGAQPGEPQKVEGEPMGQRCGGVVGNWTHTYIYIYIEYIYIYL